jgi:hypothetical protein
MQQSSDSHYIPMTSVHSGDIREARPDVIYYTDQIVNVVFIGKSGGTEWVLVDAGMPGKGGGIMDVANSLYGPNPPSAIILTHGHFDHVGSIVGLLQKWGNIPVYAHPLEEPFLTGKQAYPEPDVTVEGGMLAKISAIYPNEPIDISEVLQMLPPDGAHSKERGKWPTTLSHYRLAGCRGFCPRTRGHEPLIDGARTWYGNGRIGASGRPPKSAPELAGKCST